MPHRQTPPHVARRLKKTLLFSVGGGVVALVGLAVTILLLSSSITNNLAQTEQTALSGADTVLSEQKVFELPENTSNVPSRLDKTTLVDVVAKNQPAVVRILSVYCADITLVSGSATYKSLDVCSAGVGSGSIISRDGYIATNGHVVVLSPKSALFSFLSSDEETQRYLEYAVAAGVVSQSRAVAILTAITNDVDGGSEALEAVVASTPSSTIRSSNVSRAYAVQLGNEPMRATSVGGRISVEYTDTVIDAELIDQDYDEETSDKSLETGQFTSSDVALLKATGSFPYVTLGSGDSVQVRDQLTAIGFPAFIDDSVSTDKWQTVPSITQGKVTDISSDADYNGRTIISTSVPIAQGESGGPSFNNKGEQIGLNTYTDLQCEDLKCFGDGLVRDIDDLKALLLKNNITLKTGGVTLDWSHGLDAYVEGNYAEALVSFGKVQNEYPANYLVSSFSRIAREQVGTSTDTSSAYQIRTVTTTVVAILASTLLVLITTIAILIVHFTRKHHRTEALLAGQNPPVTPV